MVWPASKSDEPLHNPMTDIEWYHIFSNKMFSIQWTNRPYEMTVDYKSSIDNDDGILPKDVHDIGFHNVTCGSHSTIY